MSPSLERGDLSPRSSGRLAARRRASGRQAARGLAVALLGGAAWGCLASSAPPIQPAPGVHATVYVSPQFEVRDRDQPVKFVFDNDTRVARVTGSLAGTERLQRLRLQAGWNLIALAVTAPDLLGQLARSGPPPTADSGVAVAYRAVSGGGGYVRVEPGETVPGGAVLWLQARTNFMAAVRGTDSSPGGATTPAGGGYVAGGGLESWRPSLPFGVTIWRYDATRHAWQPDFNNDLAALSNGPPEIAPGEAVYVHSPEPISLAAPNPIRRVAYYHPDHLGSASVLTDAAGGLVEETSYHPFGSPRHPHHPDEARAFYGFTQKERDQESALHYFEARSLAASLGRFISFDPNLRNPETLNAGVLREKLAAPATLNPFVYALNNPQRYVDPDGRDSRPRPSEAPRTTADTTPGPPRGQYIFRVGAPPQRPGQLSALAYGIQRDGPANSGTSASREPARDFKVMRNSDQASLELHRKATQGEPIKGLTLSIPRKGGEDLHLILVDVYIDRFETSESSADGRPVETLTLHARDVWIGDDDAPAPDGAGEARPAVRSPARQSTSPNRPVR